MASTTATTSRTCSSFNCAVARRRPGLNRMIAVQCEKAEALESLRATTDGLSQHLQNSLPAKPQNLGLGSFSATASQDEQDMEEINQNNYYERIEGADAPVVLVDFYTRWCGPCKLMYPTLLSMKEELAGQVTFYKFNCNKANEQLGKKLNIKVAPTFILYKGGEEVKRLTGAKIDPLKDAIAEVIA